MTQVIQDLSAPDLVTTLENNIFAIFTYYAQANNTEFYFGSNMIRFVTGVATPLLNGVIRTQLQPQEIDTTIRETLEYFSTKQLPMLWWTGPATQPPDLGKYLEAQGLINVGILSGMAIDLSVLPPETPVKADFVITTVSDQQSLKYWTEIVAIAFEIPDTQWDAFYNLELSLGWESKTFIRFIGYDNDLPVATSALYLDGQVAGLYYVATRPEARRKGFAKAIVLAALYKARSLGYLVATLQASQMGINIYRQIGFQEYFPVTIYSVAD
ncbi:GNAT family N-acetyltransferase [Anabaena azotica]|uniref:GNAT family N-acetyltransferase n=1 Tax=Anabaena azotica FACHB-119 TaxID=947527 RepID=A0ABR8DAA4_9NOST|nr:GNAT family N-acetyltransferase [Anabaena azotica]MBD2503516.1 GNAT family N-acetyltransferase [Anabaena azotica FACHB-119]